MDPGLRGLIAHQTGIVTRAQVIACGMTDGWLVHHVRAGRWQSVGRGVYSTTTGATTPEQPSSTAVVAELLRPRGWRGDLRRCGPGVAWPELPRAGT